MLEHGSVFFHRLNVQYQSRAVDIEPIQKRTESHTSTPTGVSLSIWKTPSQPTHSRVRCVCGGDNQEGFACVRGLSRENRMTMGCCLQASSGLFCCFWSRKKSHQLFPQATLPQIILFSARGTSSRNKNSGSRVNMKSVGVSADLYGLATFSTWGAVVDVDDRRLRRKTISPRPSKIYASCRKIKSWPTTCSK